MQIYVIFGIILPLFRVNLNKVWFRKIYGFNFEFNYQF